VDRENVMNFLKMNVKGFKTQGKGNDIQFSCPLCDDALPTARFIEGTDKINCFRCNFTGDIKAVAMAVGTITPETPEKDVNASLAKELGLPTEEDKARAFDFYKENLWDLVPLACGQKIPFEKDWLNINHYDPSEWIAWIAEELNVGVKCGKRSGITIVDVDQEVIPAEIDAIKGDCLIQKTGRGWHLVYAYEPSLATTRIDEYKVDILNDGKQAVIFPSVMKDGTVARRFTTDLKIEKMPEALLKLLASKITVPVKTQSEKLTEEINLGNLKINPDDFKMKNNQLDGCCNTSFLKLGGLLRKEQNSQETEYVLKTLNRALLEKPMDNQAMSAMCRSIDKYIIFDEKELAHKVLQYLKVVEFANSKEIKEAIGFEKENIDKSLAYLVREGYAVRKGRNYQPIKKGNWKDDLAVTTNYINFKMPYFEDYANMCWGDMVLLASKSKYGKTTIAMNIIQQLVQQGIKPYYISLEAGSRFAKTAIKLGIKQGDFYWDFISDPTKIELEPNAVTILDWLLVEDKSQTDAVMKHFVEQLHKSQGYLIAFQQCKEDGSYYAPNMVKQFPALAARYLYEDDTGSKGKWIIDAIRDPKKNNKGGDIPCAYNWDDKTLNMVK
jgi:hypothetical protein